MSARAQRYAQRSRLQGSSPEPDPQQKLPNVNFRSRLQSIGASDEPRTTPTKELEKEDAAPRQVMEQFEAAFALHPSASNTGTRCAALEKKGKELKNHNRFTQLSGMLMFTIKRCKLTT